MEVPPSIKSVSVVVSKQCSKTTDGQYTQYFIVKQSIDEDICLNSQVSLLE